MIGIKAVRDAAQKTHRREFEKADEGAVAIKDRIADDIDAADALQPDMTDLADQAQPGGIGRQQDQRDRYPKQDRGRPRVEAMQQWHHQLSRHDADLETNQVLACEIGTL